MSIRYENVYNDLPNDLKSMVEDYSGPLHPGPIELAKEVCCEFTCGGNQCDNINRFYRLIVSYKHIIIKWTLFVLAVLGCLAATALIVYAILFPVNNMFIGLIYSDIKCDWYLKCIANAIDTNGNQLEIEDRSKSLLETALPVFGITIFGIAGIVCVIILLVLLYGSLRDDDGLSKLYWFYVAVAVYVFYAISIVLIFNFHWAKYFGYINDAAKCGNYNNFVFVSYVYKLRSPPTSTDPFGNDVNCGNNDCCPFKSLGFLKGVQVDYSLSWDIDTCNECKKEGWAYVAFFLIIPIIMFISALAIYYVIKRCKETIRVVQNRYHIERV